MRDFVTYWVFVQSEPIVITKRSPGPPSGGYNRFQAMLAGTSSQGVATSHPATSAPAIRPAIFPNFRRIFQNLGGGGGGGRLRLNSIFGGNNRRTSLNGKSNGGNATNVSDAVGDSSSSSGRRSLCDMHILKRLFCNIFNYD